MKKYKSLIVIGGTGSFGQHFIKNILENQNHFERVVVFSRDELKQWEMSQKFPSSKFPQLRFFLGDIRDKDRLTMALESIDLVIHAAALKQVPASEYNPMEFIKTNIIGSQNLIDACLKNNVKKVIALSTDKAASPINLYGATKLCADKLFISANLIKGSKDISFSNVRYGNVMGSRGSVIPLFIKYAKRGIIPITDKNMTRFNISLDEGVSMVKWAVENSFGGEIFVPKIPSYKIMDLKEAIGPNCDYEIIGLRPGEKIHEEMITLADGGSTIDLGKYYAILPAYGNLLDKYSKNSIQYTETEKDFIYNSGKNPSFLSISEIRNLIKLNIDTDFKPV